MLKPPSLRNMLLQALPELATDPDRLIVLARGGRLVKSATASLSFEYAFTLNAVVLDFRGHPDAIMVPVLAWTKVNQPELFANPDTREKAVRFEVEYVNSTTVDVSVEIDLTERVLVTPRQGQAGAYDIKHVPEPPPVDALPYAERWQLYLRGDLLAEWDTTPS